MASELPTSKTESLADRFKAKFSQAHSQSRPLIISWELAVEIRDALSGDSPAPDTGLAGQIEAARARIAGWPADVRAAMGLPDETSEPPHELRPLLDNGLKALDAGVPIQPTSYFHEELKRLLAMPSEEPTEDRRPTGQCSWGCYYASNGRLVRDSACTVHGASSDERDK